MIRGYPRIKGFTLDISRREGIYLFKYYTIDVCY